MTQFKIENMACSGNRYSSLDQRDIFLSIEIYSKTLESKKMRPFFINSNEKKDTNDTNILKLDIFCVIRFVVKLIKTLFNLSELMVMDSFLSVPYDSVFIFLKNWMSNEKNDTKVTRFCQFYPYFCQFSR